jgi:hypothetical protein
MDDYRYQSADPRTTQWIVESILGAVVIGILFGAGQIAYGLWYDAMIMPSPPPLGVPMRSHGQQVGLMVLLNVVLGGAVGLAIGVARRFNLLVAALLPAAAGFLLAGHTAQAWSDSLEHYGRDPSDWVVYVPSFVSAGIAVGIALAMAIAGWLRRPSSATR